MYPMMLVSRLLKSCAMPPVSCPTTSIFCAWRKRASDARRACAAAARSNSALTRTEKIFSTDSMNLRCCNGRREKITSKPAGLPCESVSA